MQEIKISELAAILLKRIKKEYSDDDALSILHAMPRNLQLSVLSSFLSEDVQRKVICCHYAEHRKLQAIKAVRVVSGMSLREAKDFVESLPTEASTTFSSGFGKKELLFSANYNLVDVIAELRGNGISAIAARDP